MKTNLLSTILILLFSAVQVFSQCYINFSNVVSASDVDAQIYWQSDNEEATYTIEYGAQGFTLGEGETLSGQRSGSFSETITITGLTATTFYHYYITETCDGVQGEVHGPREIFTDSECRSPQNAIAEMLSPTSIRISWTSLNGGRQVNFSSNNGLTNYQGISQDGYNEIVFENLLPDTEYSGSLYETCSGQTSVGRGLSVRTDTECRTPVNFEVEDVAGTTVTLSWESLNSGASYTIEYGNQMTFEEPGTGDEEVSGTSNENNEVTLVGLSSGTPYKVTLKEKCDGEGQTRLQQTNFHTPNTCNQPSLYEPKRSINSISVEIYTWNFDDGFTSEEGEYTLEYGLTGFNRGTGETITGTFSTNTYEILIEDLLPETEYDFYLTEKCDEGDVTIQFQASTISECEPIRESYFYVENRGLGEVLIEWYDSYNSGRPYTIEYGEEGFTQGEGITLNGIVNTWGGGRVAISGLEQTTTYDFYYTESCANDEFTTAVKKTITTVSDCEKPYNFRTRTEGSNDLLLSFNNYSVGQNYSIEYGVEGFELGTGTTISAEITSRYMEVLIDGLTEETSYDFYLSITCPVGSTELVGPLTVTTTEMYSVPSNDLCANATLVLVDNEYNGTTIGATTSDRPEGCLSNPLNWLSTYAKGVWYQFVATSTTPVEFSVQVENESWGWQIEVYKGTCGALICEKAIDDEIITIQPEIGATYYVYVSRGQNNIGDFTLKVSENSNYVPCVSATNIQISDIETDKATFSWESNGAAYYYAGVVESGGDILDEDAISGVEEDYTDTFVEVTLSSLEEGKSYDFYLYEECESGEFVLAGPFTFSTIISSVDNNKSYDHQTMAYLIQIGDAIQLQDINNDILEINVFDMSSTPVSYQKQGNTITLQTSTSGMYILKMLTAEGYRFAKVIVQ